MPSLAQATSQSLEALGYERIAAALPTVVPSSPLVAPASNTRSALPSTVVSPVTLGLFGRAGGRQQTLTAVPQLSDTADTVSTTTNVTNEFVASGGSTPSSSSIPATTATVSLSASTTAFTTPVLSQGTYLQASIQMGLTFILLRVTVSAPARVQFYSSSAAQQLDLARGIDTPPTAGSANGLIADFNLVQASELSFVCSPAVIGFNGESPRSASTYITVTNTQATSTPITVSLLYLPLEN